MRTLPTPLHAPGESSLIENLDALTPTVLAAFSKIDDPRLREITTSLISHLHACVRETGLTPEEWEGAVDFLNRLGGDGSRRFNGAMALSDMLGISTLVCMINDQKSGQGDFRTAQNVLGPLWRDHAPAVADGGTIVRSETPGAALFVAGRVLDTQGHALAGVQVEIWQASPDGYYENQQPDQQETMNLRGRMISGPDGRFRFRTVLPSGYPASGREPLATMLRTAKRNPYRPAHLHFMLVREGFRTLITQIFTPYCPHLHYDLAFGATRELVGNFERHENEAPPADDVRGTWYSLDQTFVMAPGESRIPAAPID